MEVQTYPNIEVVMCDDGSTDGTAEAVQAAYPKVKVVQGTGNLWWTGGINRCIQHVLGASGPGDYVLTINNDVVVDPDYVERKVRRAGEYPDSMIGSVCVFLEDPNKIETSGFILNYSTGSWRPVTKRGQPRDSSCVGVRRVTHVPGKGVLIPVALFQRFGIYDEARFPHYHADSDFALVAHEAGIPVLVDFDTVVYSDVNQKNMTIPGQAMSLQGVVRTFRGLYSPNNWTVNYRFARKHLGRIWWLYLIRKYTRIIGGMALRYASSKLQG